MRQSNGSSEHLSLAQAKVCRHCPSRRCTPSLTEEQLKGTQCSHTSSASELCLCYGQSSPPNLSSSPQAFPGISSQDKKEPPNVPSSTKHTPALFKIQFCKHIALNFFSLAFQLPFFFFVLFCFSAVTPVILACFCFIDKAVFPPAQHTTYS